MSKISVGVFVLNWISDMSQIPSASRSWSDTFSMTTFPEMTKAYTPFPAFLILYFRNLSVSNTPI